MLLRFDRKTRQYATYTSHFKIKAIVTLNHTIVRLMQPHLKAPHQVEGKTENRGGFSGESLKS